MNKEKLRGEQIKLSQRVELKDGFKKVNKVGGIDQVIVDKKIVSCLVVCDYKNMEILEKSFFEGEVKVPYQAGFLAYREMPAMVEAFNQLNTEPEVILVDGHGILHPRRLGLASHFGLIINKPTVGVAKSLLVGEVKEGKIYVGNDMRGFEFRSKEYAKPLYISPGNLVSFGSALRITKETIREPHKLPEPLHIAKRMAKKKIKG